jgi:hypothetical protein
MEEVQKVVLEVFWLLFFPIATSAATVVPRGIL